MSRTMKRLLLPILAAAVIPVIVLSFLSIADFNPADHEIVTVYCVTEVKRSAPLNPLTQYSHDEKGRILEINQNNGKTIKNYGYDKDGNPILYPHPGGGTVSATYDKNGNLLTSKRFSDNTLTKINSNEEYTYDRNGNLIKAVSYGDDGEPLRIDTFTYDENGNLLTRALEYQQDQSVPNQYFYADYDESGNLIRYQIYYDESLRFIYLYEYNDAGQIISSEYQSDGKIISKQEHFYDQTGQLIQSKDYYPQQNFLLESTVYDYEYDAFGNLLKQTATDKSGTFYIHWTYDSNGNMTSYDNGPSMQKFYYDSNGNIIKEEWIYNDTISTTEYTYETFQVTRKEAEFIKSQQEEIIRLPTWDIIPKTILEAE